MFGGYTLEIREPKFSPTTDSELRVPEKVLFPGNSNSANRGVSVLRAVEDAFRFKVKRFIRCGLEMRELWGNGLVWMFGGYTLKFREPECTPPSTILNPESQRKFFPWEFQVHQLGERMS